MGSMTHARETRRRQQAAARRKAQLQSWLIIGGLLVIVGGALFLSLSAAATPGAPVGPARVGQPLADFTLTDTNGVTHKLSDYRGRPVLINAWATWCPPCRAEMPDLHAFYLEHQAEGFELLAINSGESAQTVAGFIQQMGFTFPALVDSNTAVLNGLGVDGLPTSIFVGRDGVVKYIHVGGLSPALIATQLAPLLTQ